VRPSAHLIVRVARLVFGATLRVDASELARLPRKGPYILVTNHINFLEAPLLYSLLYPRDIAGFAKADTWRNPVLGLLATAWECVPVDREASSDMGSMRLALEALSRGKILNIMPEGTRSHDGRLGQGHPGVVTIARRAGVPIVPVAHYGGESFWSNLRRGRRTEVRIRVGEPFLLREPEPGRSRSARAEATEEIMRSLARLLPPEYRGAYAESGEEPFRQLLPLGAGA
jgi:1-acyl-sn-glycerol-3-phosphate acyltransferase